MRKGVIYLLQAVMTEPGNIMFKKIHTPEIIGGQVLIKIMSIGVCGSDIHVYHGKHPYTSYPVVQGHEVSGEIVKVSSGVEQFKVGDKVTIQPQVVCGKCYDMGPKRDVVGELEKAYRAQGMKYMVALHHAENDFFIDRVEGTDSMNPKFEEMFSKVGLWSREKCSDLWYAKTEEIINKFSPDLLWFDYGLSFVPDVYKRKFLKYYYNYGIKNNIDVAVIYKDHHFPVGSGIVDLELGRFNEIQYNEWMTDSTIDDGEAWGYMHDSKYKSATEIIHYLIDNVSKNGYLLLNVGPKADGTIPDEAKEILKKMGNWLEINGEAIYGTSPWYVAGEGPTKMQKSGMFTEDEKLIYTYEDIRFTVKEDDIYALILAYPAKETIIKSVATHLLENEIDSIQLLGCDRKLNYKINGTDIVVEMPDKMPCEHAYVLKIGRKSL